MRKDREYLRETDRALRELETAKGRFTFLVQYAKQTGDENLVTAFRAYESKIQGLLIDNGLYEFVRGLRSDRH